MRSVTQNIQTVDLRQLTTKYNNFPMPISLTTPNNFCNLSIQNLTNVFGTKRTDDLKFPSVELELDQHKLENIVNSSRTKIDYWTEQELVIKHLSLIFEIANLEGENYSTFAQRPISATVEGYDFGGYVDFVVASGQYEPTIPYFFVHEFKKSLNQSGDPFAQLLGELLVAQELNQSKLVYGLVIIGKLWNFITMNGKEFSQEESLDSTNFGDLSQIFYRLNGIKQYIEIEVKK